MTNIELYINGALCDIGPDFGVRLNRQLINPGELNTKDAQYSYAITLPDTARNNANFAYAIVEETRNKFNRLYTAELVVNSVRIFKGNFRLSEINRGYKGNLYIPAQKSIKDIFGDLALNANAEYRIPFLDFATYVNQYNQDAADEPQAAIFPFVLYGLLPKVPLDKNANTYSGRTVWDSSVRFGIQDLPPAINALIILRHFFASRGYQLTGSAFDDQRLTRLYMSYKNPAEYVQPWNYGQHATIRLTGAWSSTKNKKAADAFQFEHGVNQSSDDTGAVYSADFLDAVNSAITIVEDKGGNVLLKTVNDASNVPWTNGQIRIPTSGFYRVKFVASLKVYNNSAWRSTDSVTGVQHICGITQNADNKLANNVYEVRLVRDKKQADFNLSGAKIDGTFYYDNQPQNETYDGDNIPKYVPQITANGQINLIDAAQDANIVVGFQFGRNSDGGNPNRYVNPKDVTNIWAQVLAAKPALSWDNSANGSTPTRLAINTPGWYKYGRVGAFDSEGDNPNINIDYSGGSKITGDILNGQGNPESLDTSDLTDRITGYNLNALTGFQSYNAAWTVTDFIEVTKYTDLRFSAVATGANILNPVEIIAGRYIAPNGTIQEYGGTDVSPKIYFNGNRYITCDSCERGGTINYTGVYKADNTLISCFASNLKVKTIDKNSYADAAYVIFTLDQGITNRQIQYGNVATSYIPYGDTSNSDAAITAFYDGNLQFIGYGVLGPESGTDSHSNELINAPAGAVYVRVSGLTVSVTGTPITAGNIILNRFPLLRWYTYTFTAPVGSGYTGYAYLFNGIGATTPVQIIPFVNGVAQINTAFSPYVTFSPYITFYLKTSDFNVDGTLIISRQIEGGSEDVIGWELTNRYHIDLQNAPTTYAKRGQYQGAAVDANWNGQGSANAVVWLEAGELLTVASVSSEGRYRQDGMHSTFGWVNHEVAFSLDIEPFRVNPDWLKVDYAGRGTAAMDWDDPVNFDVDSINLVGFLNGDMKTDEFIDNFCKAFNLRLSQLSAGTFSLDVKQSKTTVSNLFINLDGLASVRDRGNTPLGLPSLYRLGFTVDTDEEGYVRTGDDGGGEYATGATEENTVEQKSNFSYGWFKNITKGATTLPLPVISKNDVWLLTDNYPTAMAKRYTDQPYRFFYYDGLLNDLGATFTFNGADLKLAKVSNALAGLSELSYKNQRYTILDNYFTILINGSSHYTELDGFITPVQYAQLNGSIMAMFNGDLYYIAELGGYDPTGKNKTKIKLIRKI